MRAVIQRVKNASVTIDGKVHGKIDTGFLVLLGVAHEDDEKDAELLAAKIAKLRIFEDENEKMNLSVSDVGGEILIVSQFTLYADCRKGRRPSFTNAMAPAVANEYYEKFISVVESITGVAPKTGEFGADMKVELLNDGPVTIMLDSKEILG